jgi:hypothetical protein
LTSCAEVVETAIDANAAQARNVFNMVPPNGCKIRAKRFSLGCSAGL